MIREHSPENGKGAAQESIEVGVLNERMERLEYQNRRLLDQNHWLRWGLVVAGFLAVVMAGNAVLTGAGNSSRPGADVVKTIRTQRLDIVDSKGSVRLRMGMAEDNRPYVRLIDEKSIPMAGLAMQPDGTPRLYLCGTDGKARIDMTVGPDGTSRMAFWSTDGGDKDNNPLVGLNVMPDDRAFLALSDDYGRMRAGLGVSASGHPGIVMMGKNEKPVWSAP